MAIVETRHYVPLTMEEDPDDYRPDSELAIVIDPSGSGGRLVRDMVVLCERIAPGDRIPLHLHTVDEVFFVDEGNLDVTLGDERRQIGSGSVVFIPARTAHGFRNTGDEIARIHAVFPTGEIAIRYVERNPAPGTEGDPPAPPVAFDVRALLEGDPERAVRVIPEKQFEPPTA